MTRNRTARGMRTQLLVARHFRDHGWPWAESAGSGRSGSDVLGVPGLAVEVKARSDLNPAAWIRQAESQAGLPLVVFRPNGVGETPGRYLAFVRLDDLIPLLRAAGYGDPPEQGQEGIAGGPRTAAEPEVTDPYRPPPERPLEAVLRMEPT